MTSTQSDTELDELISIVAHELKTPLTPLKSVAQLMRMRIKRARSGERDLDTEAIERGVATIERQVDRMDRLVNDLLEVSRIGRGTFELRPAPFDLAATARDVVKHWTDVVVEEGRHLIELDAPASAQMVGDQNRIEHALTHLVGNAVKFSPRGGTIAVRLDMGSANASVTVSDEGIGIAPAELASIGREPFVRAQRARGYAGIGLGIYLSRRIAEAHGGELQVESAGEDQGTTTKLTLPR